MKILVTILLIITGFIAKSQPVSFIYDYDNGCAPLNVQFTNNTGGDTTGMKFYWFIDESIVDSSFHFAYNFNYAKNYRITLKGFDSGSSYIGEYSWYINVRGNPGYVTSDMGTEVCPNELLIFRVYSNYWNYNWSMSDGFTSNRSRPTHSFTSEGIYNVQLIAEGECGIDTINTTFTVTNTAIPSVNIWTHSGNFFCPNTPVYFNNDFTSKYYLWNFGDGSFSTSKNPIHSFTNTGNYTVILTVTNECGNINKDTLFVNVDNGAIPNALFNAWPSMVCPGERINFSTYSSGTYLWDLGNGINMTSNEFTYSYPDTGSYNVTLTVSNSCGSDASSNNTIYVQYNTSNPPNSQFEFDVENSYNIETISVCPNTEISFRNHSWGNGTIHYLWDFGDGNTSTQSEPSHIFSTPGINTVALVVYNTCGAADTSFKFVNVDMTIMPESQLQNLPSIICSGEAVYYYADEFNSSYVYNVWFGDGQSSLNITEPDTVIGVIATHVYNTVGTYNFIFTATNTCGNIDTLSGTIEVDNSGINPPFYYVMNSTTQENQLSNLSNFSTSLTGNEHQFNLNVLFPGWQAEYNDSALVAFWYDAGTNFNGEPDGYILIDGFGTGTAYVPVNGDSVTILGVWWCNGLIEDEPSAFGMGGVYELTPSGNTTVSDITLEGWDGICGPDQNPNAGCPGDEINFMALGGISQVWHFGDGATANTGLANHIYSTEAIYNAFAIITNGCGSVDTVYSQVEIIGNKIPQADFYINTNGANCINSNVYFYPESDGDSNDNLTYYWEFGDGNTSTSRNPIYAFSTGGSHNVTLTVTNNCGVSNSNTQQVWVQGPVINSNVNHGCPGLNNGSVEVEVIDGWWPMSFSWSSGQTVSNINNLAPGTYSLTVTDNGGCQKISSYIINTDNPLEVTLNKTDISCNGLNDGAIVANATEGNIPYYFYWNNGSGNNSINGLSQGTYTVTVVDGNACQVIKSGTINEPLVIFTSIVGTDQSCFVGGDGSADLSVSGGTAPFNFNWTGAYTVEDPTGLSVGDYYVTVTDINSCSATDMVTISSPTDIVLTHILNHASCGVNDGNIDISVSGGITPYTYIWSNAATTEDLSGLSANFYSVTITDANGCKRLNTYSVENLGAPTINAPIISNVTCNGYSDGSIDISIIGGVTPYTILWSNTQSTASITGLSGGNYSVTVTSGDGCLVINPQINVYEPVLLTINANVVNQLCSYSSDGYINLNINGGSSPHSYLWNDSSTDENLLGINAGIYSVIVTDDKLCTAAGSYTLTAPATISISESITNLSCFGDLTGAIDLTVTGGTGSYTYLWNPSATTEDLTGIAAGTYDITVTDANSCTETKQILIIEPAAISISESITNLSCFGDLTGAIDLTVTGGTGSYTYLWNPSATTEDLTGIAAGTYDITVTDANSCTGTKQILISEPAAIITVLDNQDSLCYEINESVILDAGNTGATYIWSTGGTNQTETIDAITLGMGQQYIYVTITNVTCSEIDSIDVFVDICENINSVSKYDNIIIYPNPSKDGKFSIINLRNNDIIKLYDLNGKLLIERTINSNNTVLDISSFPNGIYNLTILNKNEYFTKRIVFINN